MGGFVFCVRARGSRPLDSSMHIVHWRGAEPKRRQWRMKRGGSLVSKGVCQTAEKAGDYCEPDRANEVKRDGVRLPYAPPYTRNPNLKPVGKGFGFLVFDLKEYIGDMT